jgi:hypothetical protein
MEAIVVADPGVPPNNNNNNNFSPVFIILFNIHKSHTAFRLLH